MTTPNTPMTEQERVHSFLELIERVATEELKHVSHLEYDSHEICTHFWGKVRDEIFAQMADLANLRYKQSGGPERDNQDRAVKLEQQWSEAARLGGRI